MATTTNSNTSITGTTKQENPEQEHILGRHKDTRRRRRRLALVKAYLLPAHLGDSDWPHHQYSMSDHRPLYAQINHCKYEWTTWWPTLELFNVLKVYISPRKLRKLEIYCDLKWYSSLVPMKRQRGECAIAEKIGGNHGLALRGISSACAESSWRHFLEGSSNNNVDFSFYVFGLILGCQLY